MIMPPPIPLLVVQSPLLMDVGRGGGTFLVVTPNHPDYGGMFDHAEPHDLMPPINRIVIFKICHGTCISPHQFIPLPLKKFCVPYHGGFKRGCSRQKLVMTNYVEVNRPIPSHLPPSPMVHMAR